MTQTTTKDICDYLERSDIPEAFKQIITQLESESQFTITDESGTATVITKQDLETILQEYITRQEDRQIIDFYQYSNLSIAFGKDSKLEELFLSEYTDLNEYKSKLAYQLHSFLFLEIGIDRILNGDFNQFWYWDEKITQALQNAYFFVNDEDQLIDPTIAYDKSIFDLWIKQYKIRWYSEISDKPLPVQNTETEPIVEKSQAVEKFVTNTWKAMKFVANTWVKIGWLLAEKYKQAKYKRDTNKCLESMDECMNKYKNYEWFEPEKLKTQTWEAISHVLNNPKIPDYVKKMFLRDYEEWLKDLKDIKNLDEDIKSHKKVRSKLSLWLWWDEPDGFYANMILSQNFIWWIQLKASIIQALFVDTITVNWKEYPKSAIDEFLKAIWELDEETWHAIKEHYEWIKEDIVTWWWDYSEEYMESHCKENWVNKENTKMYIKLAYGFWHKMTKLINIKKDILDWKWSFFGIWEAAEWKIEDLAWLEKIDTDIDIENQFWEKLENLGLVDLVIALNQLVSMVYVVGDAHWGWQDLYVAYE